ncbi:MAG: tRNA (guanine(46)-N(7))-methyltransferase TrmB [Thermoanaerobaculia bacterium]
MKKEAGVLEPKPDEILWGDQPCDPRRLFGRNAPLEVEIGSGKARFLIEAARTRPSHDFLGLERSLSYYRICRDRVARTGLPNIRVLRADGRALTQGLPVCSVHAFHVYFSDPWPKKKQRKRRFLDGVTLELLASRLEPGGVLRIATDHSDYGATVASLCQTVSSLERLEWSRYPEPPLTHYELKYRAEGRPIWRFLLVKR